MAIRQAFPKLFPLKNFLRNPERTFQRRKCQRKSIIPPNFRWMLNPNNVDATKRTALRSLFIISPIPNFQRSFVEDIPKRERPRSGFFRSIHEAIVILIRVFVIGSVLTGLALMYLITRYTHSQDFPNILRKGIELLGPIFIKFGQWASTRKDLFPPEVCNALSSLQRKTPAHSWIYTKGLLKATYGPSWKELFVEFEGESPIGSGCCAQVYKAWVDLDVTVKARQHSRVSPFIQTIEYFYLGHLITFLDNCTRINAFTNNKRLMDKGGIDQEKRRTRKLQAVAVKVLHPGIKEQLRRDLSIMRAICRFVMFIKPRLYWLSLTDCIDEFSEIMENQIDMTVEAKNLIRFSKNFSNRRDVDFPRPYLQYTHQEILVETYEDGQPISDYINSTDHILQENLAKIGMKTILQMIFNDNFIHCDLHPGNMLVQLTQRPNTNLFDSLLSFFTRNRSLYDRRVIILDCGLVVSLSEQCRRNLKDVFRSVLIGNGALAAEHMMQHSTHIPVDPDGFRRTLTDIVNSHRQAGLNLANVAVSTVVNELFSAMVRHRVKQDGSFSSVILSMMVIEGLGRSLDPSIDIFKEALPFLFNSTIEDNIS